MRTGTAVAAIADKVINNSECVDRILKIVQRLEQEANGREADFQFRIKQAVEEARQRAEDQYRVQQERAVSEAIEETRKDVTQTLLNRFDLEISKLHTNFDRRLHQVVTETEALEKLKIDSAVTTAKETIRQQLLEEAKSEYQSRLDEMEKLTAQLKEAGALAATERQTERQQFEERIAGLERTLDTASAQRTEKLDGYKELERRLEETLQSKAQLQLDLQRAVSELNSQTQSAATADSHHAARGEVNAIVQAEMVRVRLRLDEIERILADSNTELGSEIRLKRERAELQAYLKGLRYSLGEITLHSSTAEECHA